MSTQAQRLIARFTGNRRKLTVMLTLLVVGLLLWGRLLFMHAPRVAVAHPVDNDAGPDAGAAPVRRVVNVDLPQDLPRDVFAFDGTGYEHIAQAPQAAPMVAKLVDKSADVTARLAAIRAEAASLRLLSTALGGEPRAMIDGILMTEGQRIKGFVVKKILPRQVVLEKDGVEVTIEM